MSDVEKISENFPNKVEKISSDIIHLGKFDVVINSGNPDKTMVADFRDVIADRNHLSIIIEGMGWGDERFKSFGGYFIKKRHSASYEDAKEAQTPKPTFGSKKTQLAFNSLLNEINLSSDVDRIIQSDEVQELARKIRYKGIRFIKPIAGIIEKVSGDKYMVYPHIDEVRFPSYDTQGDALGSIVPELEEIFTKNLIDPYDLEEKQILITKEDGGYILNLIDIEGYTRIEE